MGELPKNGRGHPRGVHASACLAVLASLTCIVWAQDKPEDVRIVAPVVDKAGAKVTLPAQFWNPKVTDWLDVALSGKPSDFLHETVLCVTTTRTLLEQSLRDIGCRDGDAWVDSVKDFPRVRGDRLLILVEFMRDGKKAVYSLDELLCMLHWGVALGPYGFMFKGDPDHTATQRAGGAGTQPGGGGGDSPDATKILRDDPQIAVQFKGIQSMSQSFADHALAYDDWEYGRLNRGRNPAALPAEVYESNGKIPLTMTFKKVTEEQLLTENAKVWHDDAFRQYILAQVETAKRIDKNKAEFWTLRSNALPEAGNRQKLLLARIEADYAALDAAWAAWGTDHLKPDTQVPEDTDALKKAAALWREHMLLAKERSAQLAVAAEAQYEQRAEGVTEAAARMLRGQELAARSRALLAENMQSREYWLEKQAKLKLLTPPPDPDDVYAKDVNLHVALADARRKMADAGVAYGEAMQTPGDAAALEKTYTLRGLNLTIAQRRLEMATLDFEIKKRQGLGADDPDLPKMRQQREFLQKQLDEAEKLIKEISGSAATQ